MVAQIDREYFRRSPGKAVKRLLSYALFEGRPITTRGRWINPLVFFLYRVQLRLPQWKEVRRPIFILGTGRSGTTVLGVVLSMHRDIGFLNEPKALWHMVHAEEDLIGSYSQGIARYRLDAEDATEERKRIARRLYGAYLGLTHSVRVLDKYPELVFRVPFVKTLFPDAKFLFLVRNGRDTCRSIERWSSRLGRIVQQDVHDWWGVNDRKWSTLVQEIVPEHEDLRHLRSHIADLRGQMDRAAVEWVLSMREGLRLLEQYPTDVKMIRYEDLCSDAAQTLQDIASFCDLPSDEKLLEYGRVTLRPISGVADVHLDSVIYSAFEKTQRQLGYLP